MSRHRIVRTMNYSDEYDGYDDVYGHSVDEEPSCISPTDAQQWIYDRNRGQQSVSSFIANNRDIEEEDEDAEAVADELHKKLRRDSENFSMPNLNEEDQVRLDSCMDEIRNVVGDTASERQLVESIMNCNFDCALALDAILNQTTSQPSPPASLNKMPTSSTAPLKEPMETGIGAKFMEKFQKQNQMPQPPVTVTKAALDVKQRGFDLNSPRLQSPVASGRNTPELTTSDDLNRSSLSQALKSKDQLTRNVQELFKKERGVGKPHIQMVVIGHVDAGKSTLMGHMLYDLGSVPQRVMHKYEQDSKKLGKQSFMYAWVLDETGEERERGITMDVGSVRFETESKVVTLLDAPGHKDFIPNMISGATQADVALLVVDATRGEFETGFEQGGQTREHALLVRSLGVSQLGVVINKLDTVNWSKDRFDEIVGKLRTFLKQAGFKETDVTYIPCSGMTGENLVKPASGTELIEWYKGPTLINVIDKFKIPERSIEKPFRMSVTDVYKGATSGFCIAGRIETGVLCPNDRILVCPIKEQATVKLVTIDDLSQTCAFAGDQVSVTLIGVDTSSITVGSILCDIQNVVPITTRMQARIVVFNIKVPITIGFPVLLHHQSLIEPAVIVKLKSQLHKGTGEVLKKNPRCLSNNSCALIEIEVTRPICIEKYSNFKELGRIMLRVGGVTIAAGLVTKVY